MRFSRAEGAANKQNPQQKEVSDLKTVSQCFHHYVDALLLPVE